MHAQPEGTGQQLPSAIHQKNGFVLLLALIAVATLSTIALVLTGLARSTTSTAVTAAHVAQAHAAAEAGIARLIHAMRSADDSILLQLNQNGGSAPWAFADAQVALLVQWESGKVDLNAGDPDLLAAFLNATLPDSRIRSRLEATFRRADRARHPIASVSSVLTPCERLGREMAVLGRTFTVLTRSKGVAARSIDAARLALVPSMTAHDIETMKDLRRSGDFSSNDPRLAHINRYLSSEAPIYTLHATAVTSKGIKRERSAVVILSPKPPHIRVVATNQPTEVAELSCRDD